ncbi:MAG: DUF3592 domain-containing protein [Acidobacteriota bacterium]
MSHGQPSSRVPLIFMALVFTGLGVLFVGIGGSIFFTEQRYRQAGVQAEGIVTGKALRHATADSGTSYEITYRLTPDGGPMHEQTEEVTVHQWERVEQGSRVPIEYVAGQPGTARVVPESDEEALVALIAMGVGGLLAVIGMGLIVAALRRGARGSATRETASEERLETDPSSRFAPQPQAVGLRRQQTMWQIARGSFFFWCGGIFLLCGLPFFIVGVFLFQDDWRFARDARSTQGMVLSKDIRVSSSGSGSRRSSTRHYEVTYRFTADGETYEGQDELSHDAWQGLREREPVEVRYRPHRPSSHHLAQRSEWMLKTIFLLLGSVFTSIGGTMVIRALRHARLEAHLRQHGVTADGIVVALEARNVRVNNVQQWRLGYEYRDFQGRRHEGAIHLPADQAQDWTVGDTGRVLYDSTAPARAVWLGRER